MMAKIQKYYYIDFIKAAYNWKFRIPLSRGIFVRIPFNRLMILGFAILGVRNPGFWFLGLAFEAAYLMYVPASPKFQDIVIGQALLKENKLAERKINSILSFLDSKAVARYKKLEEQCEALLKSNNTIFKEKEIQFWEFKQLLSTFLQLLTSKARIQAAISGLSEEKIRKEIDELVARLSKQPEGSPLHSSLSGSVSISWKRLENYSKARENFSIIDAELDRIEKQISLLREESALINDPSMLTLRLDAIMQSMQKTARWLHDTNDLSELTNADLNFMSRETVGE